MTIRIIGSAVTPFGELWNKNLRELLSDAMLEAITNASLSPTDVEAIFVANKAAGNFENQHHLNALVSMMFPHYPPAMRVEAACASGSMAMIAAELALLSGRYKTVVVVGGEKMTDVSAQETTHILSGAADNATEIGSTFPALYALIAKSHMNTFGTTRDQVSAVAVKNHKHAMKNANAQFHKEITIEQVNQSQLIADPLRLLDCSPVSDGAAAVVLSTRFVKGSTKLLGFGHAQDSINLSDRSSLTTFRATEGAMQQALAQTGLTRQQLQAAEVHDCFTIAEILAIEDLGFFPKGEGGRATIENKTTVGGQIVINPSGGLKACGHPVGATGVKQIAFLNSYIQRGDAKAALAHNVGGSGATAVVHILQK